MASALGKKLPSVLKFHRPVPPDDYLEIPRGAGAGRCSPKFSTFYLPAKPAPPFRLKPIQLPKQTLDLKRLQFGQGEFILYAL
ncbi:MULTISPECIES: hypothetical protein [Paraburkholderia]|uniref:Uncharacterized protein n=1 Tax=Paraburkholderia madseniana TaxID=2599607 RepID=A0AAP5BGG5_9BURK|nr:MULTISPECIES: hypothetical protein [Paraburkholderia]MCX4149289.1 hypothetical protein [Paraburkholderia madseniana]MDN7152224.1 hypothetical protein [Paraburkholderia sp. WS6]MDQ6411106.1 hypothetical protein [Paraburkholderia madseniana]